MAKHAITHENERTAPIVLLELRRITRSPHSSARPARPADPALIAPAFQTGHIAVYLGDALTVLRELPADSVDCVVTSPPYWGLRDYGVAGQLGLERTPPAFVAAMVEVFREVRRVLTPHGTLWLNLGDSYATRGGSPTVGSFDGGVGRGARPKDAPNRGKRQPRGAGRWGGGDNAVPELKAKDMVGIPWRVAFALQEDGWYLRSDIIWAKPNPMPESVTDRPTKAHEYVFLLAKSERYYYDAAAIREPLTSSPSDLRKMSEGLDRIGGKNKRAADHLLAASAFSNVGRKRAVGDPALGRNARTVWDIATHPYPDAHFATFPEELPRRCILAGSPEQVCETCGTPRARITTATYTNPGNRRSNGRRDGEGYRETGVRVMASGQRLEKQLKTTGWTDCGHDAYRLGVVLDPFAGSGTTMAVARDLGRKSIGIELSPEYLRLIESRCAQEALALVVGA